MSDDGPESLIEAVRHFADPDTCHAFMVSIKWPDGRITCPKCGGVKVGEVKSRRLLQCKAAECRKQFSAKAGTIFEDSPLPLSSWFVAVWCIANAKNGISSCELARALGVTQKSAWFMLHRIRTAMRTKSFRKLAGVEIQRAGEVRRGAVPAADGAAGRPTHDLPPPVRNRRLRPFREGLMPDDKKPLGGEAFDSLARKLAAVPKAELDRQLRADRKRRAKKRKKKK